MWLAHCWTQLLAWLSWIVGRRTLHASQIGKGKTVVIVGGGFAGVTLAHYLESSTAYRIILYTGRDFFEYTPSMLRVLCDPSHMSVSHCAFRAMRMLQDTRVEVREEFVVELAERGVRGQKSGWCGYDKLVLAMGSDYPDHLKPSPSCSTLEQRTRDILATHDAMRTARRITIFGGGLVGVELAAEIVEAFPETLLTFRQREPYLLPGFPAAAQEYARRFFQRPGRRCELIFNNAIPPFKYAHEEGEVVFNCTGVQPVRLPAPAPEKDAAKPAAEAKSDGPAASSSNGNRSPRGSSKKKKATRSRSNSSASASSPSSSAADGADSSLPFGPLLAPFRIHDRTGLVCVDSTLRVIGHSDVYALGDVMVEADLLEQPAKRQPKVAYQAELQAWAVSENLKREAESAAAPTRARPLLHYPSDLVGAPSAPSLVCCSLGHWDGLVIFNSLVVPGLISVAVKTMLERSKMNQLRGGLAGTMIWTVLEPMSLLQHRLYLAVANLFGGAKKPASASAPAS